MYNVSVWLGYCEISGKVPVEHDSYDTQSDIQTHEKSRLHQVVNRMQDREATKRNVNDRP